jgi:hypothetical protein
MGTITHQASNLWVLEVGVPRTQTEGKWGKEDALVFPSLPSTVRTCRPVRAEACLRSQHSGVEVGHVFLLDCLPVADTLCPGLQASHPHPT